MAVTAKTETLERELLHRESTNQGRRVTLWVIGVAAVLIGLAAALWAQWQPVERSAGITQSQTFVREAVGQVGQPGRITYSNVQAREAVAGLGTSPARITYSNVQAREAVAGLGTSPARITYSNVQAREAVAGLGTSPARITYSNVQAREAVAGLGGRPAQITFSDVQVREAP